MSLRKIWEKEILIRLTESGFVETIRCFGRERSCAYELTESAPAEMAAGDERLLTPVRVRRNEKNPAEQVRPDLATGDML